MEHKNIKISITKGSIPYFALILGICFSIFHNGFIPSLLKVVSPSIFFLVGDELKKTEHVKQVKDWDFIEGRDEERKQIPEGALEYQDGSLHLSQEMLELLEEENEQNTYGVSKELLDELQKEQRNECGETYSDQNLMKEKQSESEADENSDVTHSDELDSFLDTQPYKEEAETDLESTVDENEPKKSAYDPYENDWFMPLESPVYHYQASDLQDFDGVVKAFFAIDESTRAKEKELDLESLLKKDCTIEKRGGEPQILIYHTHASETYVGMEDSVDVYDTTNDVTNGQDTIEDDAGNQDKTVGASVVDVGEYLASILEDKYGYSVLHHTVIYDQDRDYAYTEALPGIEQVLKENPSIQLVIDLHRDEMAKERRLVTNIQGKECAQYMFFCGMSRLRKSGELEYLANPYRQDNLDLAFRMQLASNQYYPGIARRIYLKAYRYNMHLCDKSLLIELGAQNNTYEEACNSCEPLAHVIDLVLSGENLSPE